MTSNKDTKVFILQVSDANSAEAFRLESKQPELYVGDVSLDHIAAPCQTTLRSLVTLLCDGPVRKRRRRTADGDWGVNDHLWEFRVVAPGKTIEYDRSEYFESSGRRDDDDSSESSVYCREACTPMKQDFDSEIGLKYVDPDDQLSALSCLEVGSVFRLTYDFGTTTEVYLRCVKAESSASPKIKLGYVELQPQQQTSVPLPTLESVPAYSYPAEKRIDAHYPTFAFRFLCATSTLGLSSRISSDEDSTFCTIEPPSTGADSIFVPLPFEDINDLLVVTESCLGRLGRDYDFCMIFPPGNEGSRLAREATENYESDTFVAMFAGPRAFLSKSREEIDRLKGTSSISQEQQFDFSKAFPKTHAQLTSGKFRWLRYVPGNKMKDPGTLKVVVGRAKGDRRAPPSQVTRTWKQSFKDLHELFCAVEASWIWPLGSDRVGNEMAVDAFLSEHDTYLGPSKPLPLDPPVVAEKDDAVILLKPKKTSPEITALAIAEVASKPYLFAGDGNGVVKLYDLEQDDPEEIDDLDLATHGREKCGVRGLQVYHSEVEERTTLYAWMYPSKQREEDDDQEDGEENHIGLAVLLSYTFVVQPDGSIDFSTSMVGESFCDRYIEDLQGHFYEPLIAAVVIAPAYIHDTWRDTIFVGFEGRVSGSRKYSTDFADYNLKDQRNEPDGNILPMIESDHFECQLGTWRAHEGRIRALSAIPKKYLVSLSVVGGMEWPGQLILWSLSNYGTPLHRIDLYLEDRSIREYPPVTGMPGGLCVHDESIVLWGDYGDTVVPIDIEESCRLKMKGVIRLGQHCDGGDHFQGYMASPPNCKHGAIIHAGEGRAWIFDISAASNAPALDKDLSRKGSTDCDGDEWRDIVLAARGIAVAQAKIPELKGATDAAGNKYVDETGVKVMAMNGQWLVTGQGNGSLVKTKLGRDLNGQCRKTSGILNSSSWSLPQD